MEEVDSSRSSMDSPCRTADWLHSHCSPRRVHAPAPTLRNMARTARSLGANPQGRCVDLPYREMGLRTGQYLKNTEYIPMGPGAPSSHHSAGLPLLLHAQAHGIGWA